MALSHESGGAVFRRFQKGMSSTLKAPSIRLGPNWDIVLNLRVPMTPERILLRRFYNFKFIVGFISPSRDGQPSTNTEFVLSMKYGMKGCGLNCGFSMSAGKRAFEFRGPGMNSISSASKRAFSALLNSSAERYFESDRCSSRLLTPGLLSMRPSIRSSVRLERCCATRSSRESIRQSAHSSE